MSKAKIMAARKTLAMAEKASGKARRDALNKLAGELKGESGKKAMMLADVVSDLASAS